MADDPIDPAADAEAAEDAVADAEATAAVADADVAAEEAEVVDEAEDPADAAADDDAEGDDEADEEAPKAKKPGALAVEKAAAPVVRRRVTSKRVTPKGTTPGTKATSSGRSQAARAASTIKDGDEEESFSRPVPPRGNYAPLPSPWWVPAIMFGLLIIGALVIMLNYMGVFGDPENLRLVIGLAFILAGIIAATQYR